MLPKFQDSKELQDPLVSQEKMNQIVQEFHQTFRRILPKNRLFHEQPTNRPPINPKMRLELIEQFDTTLQLLVQNVLLCPSPEIKSRSLKLLKQQFEYKRTMECNMRLPTYSVNTKDFVVVHHEEVRQHRARNVL